MRPAIDDLVWVSHWITPVGEASRRFDTRFFVAVAPPGQTSRHDDNETIASAWIAPGVALQRRAQGELTMMPPTIKSLEYLAAHDDAASVMESARRLGRPEPILPRLRRDADGRIIGVSLPGDDDYADLELIGGVERGRDQRQHARRAPGHVDRRRDLVDDLAGDRAELVGRQARAVDRHRSAGVATGRDGRLERHLAEQLDTDLVGQRLAAAGAEQRRTRRRARR